MTPPIFFVPLHVWATRQTGDEAKTVDAPGLTFDLPSTVPEHFRLRAFDTADLGVRTPASRVCCALGDSGPLELDEVSAEPHQYRQATPLSLYLPGGGTSGYVYTRRGGFIDLGHVRDYVDFTRYFASKFREAPLAGLSGVNAKLFNEAGDVHLIVAPRALRPDPVLCALMGAKLAYERATWHEIASYFPVAGELDQKFSAFAPEDNFSNAVGVLAGYRTALTPDKDYHAAADKEILRILGELQPAKKSETTRAIEYVKDFWWDSFSPTTLGPVSKRRNFQARPPVKPWLVTDIKVPGKTAAGDALRKDLGRPKPAMIDFPLRYNGVLLDDLAHLEITSIRDTINEVRPVAERLTPLKIPKLWALTQKVRQAEVFLNHDGDSPGELVP